MRTNGSSRQPNPRESGPKPPFPPQEQGAPAYLFLAADDSRFVNAEVPGVTGGGILG
jgi:hypothetical protein